MKKYLWEVLLLFLTGCSQDKAKEILPKMNLGLLTTVNEECLNMPLFSDIRTFYLEKTSSLSSRNAIQQVTMSEATIYCLADGKLHSFNANNGERLNIFDSISTNYSSFDIDTISHRIYALNKTEIVCYDLLGNRVSQLPLQKGLYYDKIAIINKGHLLLTTAKEHISQLYSIDYENRQQKPFQEFSSAKDIISDIADAPISVLGHCKQGLLYYYQTSDTLFLVKQNKLIPFYTLEINKKVGGKSNFRLFTIEEADRNWHIQCKYSFLFQDKEYRWLQLAALQKSLNIDYASYHYITSKESQAVTLNGRQVVYMSKNNKKMLQINTGLLIDFKSLPPELQENKNNNDLIINIFTFKTKKR